MAQSDCRAFVVSCLPVSWALVLSEMYVRVPCGCTRVFVCARACVLDKQPLIGLEKSSPKAKKAVRDRTSNRYMSKVYGSIGSMREHAGTCSEWEPGASESPVKNELNFTSLCEYVLISLQAPAVAKREKRLSWRSNASFAFRGHQNGSFRAFSDL